MAHELATHDGNWQSFAVGESPWHQLGQVLPAAPSYDEALRLLHFDYPLEKKPFFRVGAPRGHGWPDTYVESGEAFYVYRPDTGKSFGVVGGSYEIVTNHEAFEPLKPLVDQGALALETGGVLRDGADAWLLGRWDLARLGPLAREVLGDEVLPYATVTTNHSGRRGVLLGNTPIRIVCANTLGAAEAEGASRWEKIDHRKGARAKLVEAAERVFMGVISRYEMIAKQYRALKQCVLTHEKFKTLVLDLVSPDPRDNPLFQPDQRMSDSVVDRAERRRARLTGLWESGKGHTGDHSAWEAVNAVAEALDHDRLLWPSRAGVWRTASLLDGHLAQLKNKVLDELVQYAQGV